MSDTNVPATPIVFGEASDVGECLRCGGSLFWACRLGEPAGACRVEFRCTQCEPPGADTVRPAAPPWPQTAADTASALARFLARASGPKA